MNVNRISAEEFARLVYDYKRNLASLFGACGDIEREWDWDKVPRDEKRLMIESAVRALSDVTIVPDKKPC